MKKAEAKTAAVEKESSIKKLSLKFYQSNGTEVVTNFEVKNDVKSSIIVGTALNELFTLQSNYRKAGIKLFKSSEPVLFLVQTENEILFNVGKCNRLILQKLKFNKTAKSMKVFSKRVNLAINEMIRDVKLIDYSEVENAINSIAE